MTRELILFADRAAEDKADFSTCRFCPNGEGLHKVEDVEKKEKFYLCEKHYNEYNIADDSVPDPVIEPAPEPDPKP